MYGDIIHGGKGDDEITGGATQGTTDTVDPAYGQFLYGDEGNDIIWGEDKTSYEYIWGGDGADTIYGGDMIAK